MCRLVPASWRSSSRPCSESAGVSREPRRTWTRPSRSPEARESSSFLCPIHAVRAEAAWLSGDTASCVAEARAVYDLAIAQQQRWYSGVLASGAGKAAISQSHPRSSPSRSRNRSPAMRRGRRKRGTRSAASMAAWARIEGDDEEELRAALSVVDQLGARPAASLARKRLRALGARGVPRGPRPATRANSAGLTRRESEIVALIGADTQQPTDCHSSLPLNADR